MCTCARACIVCMCSHVYMYLRAGVRVSMCIWVCVCAYVGACLPRCVCVCSRMRCVSVSAGL